MPQDFVWGTATSAYQIEGAVTADGRGRSVWDAFCSEPGRVANGDSGAIACDHYNRMTDDVALLRELGMRAYRFSIAWPRVMPSGSGDVNGAGLGFYDRLVDELLACGITPIATLYHWDLPEPLEQAGGWASRETVGRFVDYAARTYEVLADRVPMVSTFNEPWCAAYLGYAAGIHAPGRRNAADSIRAAHHQLLAHGLAIQAMRAIRPDRSLGIVLNPAPVGGPPSPSDADLDVVRRVDGLLNRWWLDSLLSATYPSDVVDDIATSIDASLVDRLVQDGDLATIAQPIDHLGVNYYRRMNMRARRSDETRGPAVFPTCLDATDAEFDGEATDLGWWIDPTGLRDLLVRMDRTYTNLPPIYITENGAAYDDPLRADGSIDDARRIAYIRGHLHSVADAIADGVDVRGYLAWSFVDNFEWHSGYEMRFGLVHIDFNTQARTPRTSAYWYRDVMEFNTID